MTFDWAEGHIIMSDGAACDGREGSGVLSFEAVAAADLVARTPLDEDHEGISTQQIPIRPSVHLIECWEFLRGFWPLWLRETCPEFEITTTSNLNNTAGEDYIRRIAAIVLGVDELHQIDQSLETYISQVRLYRPDIPVIAIFPIGSSSHTNYWIRRVGINGYIPRSTNIEVAAAALRLVIAGGQYFPHTNTAGGITGEANFQAGSVQHDAYLPNTLTPREMAVLDRLSRGNANKIIAYELNISLSTVKAHVHSIIRKMKVRNRTEVVVMARDVSLAVNHR